MASSLSILALLLLAVAVAVADAATFNIINKCSYTVWPGAIPGGGIRLDPGQGSTMNVPAGTASARIWPRTGCTFDGSGRGSCATGDCGGVLACSAAGQPPTTLAEYTLGQGSSADFYDLSLVDGFNVPMSVQPMGGGGGGGGCRAISCAADITAQCPAELKVDGGCASACEKLGGDTYCCRGQYTNNCPPTNYSQFFKGLCPDAYSYAKDDQTSTFTCPADTNYQVVFCP